LKSLYASFFERAKQLVIVTWFIPILGFTCLAKNITIIVKDNQTNEALPFAWIIIDNKIELCDIYGTFKIDRQTANDLNIKITHLGYDTVYFVLKTGEENKNFEVFIARQRSFYLPSLNEKARDSVLKKINITEKTFYHSPRSFTSYNKLVVNTPNQQQIDAYYKKLIKIFRKKQYNVIDFSYKHHLLLMESYTETEYLNRFVEKEKIIASNLSGFETGSILNLSARFLNSFPQLKYLKTPSGNAFANPAHIKNRKKYDFFLINQSHFHDSTQLTLAFESKNKLVYGDVEGIIWINKSTARLEKLFLRKNFSKKSQILAQKYTYSQNGFVYPEVTVNQYSFNLFSGTKAQQIVNVRSLSINSSWNDYCTLKPFHYNGCYLSYMPSLWDSTLITNYRKINLSLEDSNTYLFYNQLGKVKGIDRVVNFGQLVYSGKIPMHRYNVLLADVLSFNQYEGVRVGLGLETNQNFNPKNFWQFSVGRGSLDNQYKFKMGYKRLLDVQSQSYSGIKFFKDLKEPASLDFTFDRPQYNTEPLRKYQLSRLDMCYTTEAYASIKPFYFLELSSALRHIYIKPQYVLVQNEVVVSQLSLLESEVSTRLALGERFIEENNQRFYTNFYFPIFQFQYRIGKSDDSYQYTYHRFDFKMQYDLRTDDWGRFRLCLVYGSLLGNGAPYFRHYNSKGSFASLYAVIHNTFETMNFNEFLSSKHGACFFTYQLPKIYVYNKYLLKFMFYHNMGWGELKNSQQFKELNIKTMEKGYYESGLALTNLLKLKLGGLITEIGPSIFLRYGPYAFPKRNNNWIYKISLGIDI